MADRTIEYNGKTQVFPEGTTDAEIVEALASNVDMSPPSMKELGMGAWSGAANVGATLLPPLDYLTGNEGRKKEQEAFFKEESNPESTAFKAGKTAAELAAMYPVGGALGEVAGMAGFPNFAKYLSSGGIGAKPAGVGPLANTAMRTSAGTLTGGAMTGLVNPEDSSIGATIGGLIPVSAQVAPLLGKTIANIVGTLGTHLGGESLIEAARAGYGTASQGIQHLPSALVNKIPDSWVSFMPESVAETVSAIKGKIPSVASEDAKKFVQNMRGKITISDVLDAANKNISVMGESASKAYKEGMVDISKDTSILDLTGVRKAIDNSSKYFSYKGTDFNERLSKINSEIDTLVSAWEKSPDNSFRTPEGVDKLKQGIGLILESIPPTEKAARKMVGEIYGAVKSEISKQAPAYEKIMKDYSDAMETLSEIRQSLSIGGKASKDTALGKLQSIMRGNASSKYGGRLELVKEMETAGGGNIVPSLAGQTLNSWQPRGLGMLAATGMGGYGLATMNPAVAGALVTQSPRLIGEAAYKVGQGAGALGGLMSSHVPNTLIRSGIFEGIK